MINIEEASRIYLLANTPGYLYRHLRSEPSVSSLARNLSVPEIAKALVELANSTSPAVAQIAMAYALAVALTLRPPEGLRELLFLQSRAPGLVWLDEIAHKAISHLEHTASVEMVAPGVPPRKVAKIVSTVTGAERAGGHSSESREYLFETGHTK